MGSFFAFAFAAALNPTLVAVTTVLLSLPRPRRLLGGYVLGALTMSFTCGILLVFALSATQSSGSASQDYVSPVIDIICGAVILLAMYRVSRHRDRVFQAWSQRRHERRQSKPPPRWQRTLANATPRKAFMVALVLTLPGASFVAGMNELSKQSLGTGAKVGLVLLFNLIQLLLIETPLVGYFVAPAGTDAAVARFNGLLSRDGNRILLIAGTVVGVLVLVRGVVRLV